MLRFFILGIGIGIGIFGVFVLTLMPVVSINDGDEMFISSAQSNRGWGAFTSALGIGNTATRIPANNLTLPSWVSVPTGAFAVRTSTTAIHKGGPGSVSLTFTSSDQPEILQEYFETLFRSKGLRVEDRLNPSDPMFNIVVSIFAVDQKSDRSARLIIREQVGLRVANLTFTTSGRMEAQPQAVAAR